MNKIAKQAYKFTALYSEQGWLEPAFVTLDADNNIIAISDKAPPEPLPIDHIEGWLIPSLLNAHSHAFQYAMSGRGEAAFKHDHYDDFWGWREAMYKLALSLDPDDIEAIAAMLYAQMLKHGYASVIEFHYVHHDKKGQRYANPIEVSERLMAAAEQAGITLYLVPVYYRTSNFNTPAREEQRRFVFNDLEEYMNFIALLKKNKSAKITIGKGVHSLRAASQEEIKYILQDDGLMCHLHIAEQLKEVEDCYKNWQQRPVEWLLSHNNLHKNINLVHATHVNDDELQGLAESACTTILCPSTEANLADGIFALAKFVKAGGRWAIGSDSHVLLDPFAELRWLDYGQRLASLKRNIVCSAPFFDSATSLLRQAWSNGNRMVNADEQHLYPQGQPLNGIVIDHHHPVFSSIAPEQRLAALLFGACHDVVKAVLVKSAVVIKDYRHHSYDRLRASYDKTMKKIWRS